ncbi:hypothetical protein TWF694_000145 [Orbilia ellipsospora]|uniref:Inositol-1-monophosphatase n=1 Tax=Orbilia ellipsospora TaxID=2528407 RepID=A0AAV9XMS7_9PEZI
MTLAELTQIHDFLIELALRGGQMMLDANPSASTSGSKKNSVDLVTDTDKSIEKMVLTNLKYKYPNYDLLGEESYIPGRKLSDNPTFICDPIDGTINFVHGVPNVCISLAFVIKKIPVVGVVYNPFQNRLFTAIKGKGAFLNRTERLPLRDSMEPLPGLNKALVAIEWGSERKGNNWDVRTKTMVKLASQGGTMCHSVRCQGSAALDMCGVAAGYLDVFWEGGCWAWDVAAGWCILTEAGGIVADANPGNWKPTVEGRRYLAVRSAPAEDQIAVVEELWDTMEGRFEFPGF